MILLHVREISPRKLETLRHNLKIHAFREPLDATCRCDVRVNGTHYRLHLLLDHGKLYAFQAQRVTGGMQGSELIVKPATLAALTELIVRQYTQDLLPV